MKGYKSGFRVLTPEIEEFGEHVRAICAQKNIGNLSMQDYENFAQLRIDANGRPAGQGLERGFVTREMAKAYWKRIREAGYIDFACIIYYSYQLLKRRADILSYVTAKFAWILVDEFQDTTDLQVEIFSLVAKEQRTRFLMVGDPCQSIFGFAGARPDLAEEFAERIDARRNLTLSGNFRSSKPIVRHANILFARTPPMESVGGARKYTEEPVWQHGASTFQVIADHSLPALEGLSIPIGDAAVLAPTWFSLFPLGRRLREYGINIVGPGARPYRRNRNFAPLAEQVCGYLIEPHPDAIARIERTVFNTLLDAMGRPYFNVFSYNGRVTVFRLLDQARQLHKRFEGAIDWLEAAAQAFTQTLLEDDYLSPSEADLFPLSVEEMKSDMRNNKVDIENLTIADLGIYASPDAALKLASLHFSKGREYEAVAMIDLHEGRIPHYYAQSAPAVEEAKRLFYVGVTRAKRFLMYITDDSDRRNGPTRFLQSSTGVGAC